MPRASLCGTRQADTACRTCHGAGKGNSFGCTAPGRAATKQFYFSGPASIEGAGTHGQHCSEDGKHPVSFTCLHADGRAKARFSCWCTHCLLVLGIATVACCCRFSGPAVSAAARWSRKACAWRRIADVAGIHGLTYRVWGTIYLRPIRHSTNSYPGTHGSVFKCAATCGQQGWHSNW